MARRKKSKMTGGLITAGLVFAGAWFHKPIMDQLHKMGIAKKHD